MYWRCFHTIMSFLGCIGHIMSGYNLQDVLEQLYASNAVTHILSRKAERAICMRTFLNWCHTQCYEIHDGITEGHLSTTDLQTLPVIQKFCDILLVHKNSLMMSKNSKLWLQYMNMLDTLRRFLKTERRGNWKLYLKALHNMLPYLAASDHNLYTKSVYLYLQDMTKVYELHPEVHAHF